jgi:hypothetical protein
LSSVGVSGPISEDEETPRDRLIVGDDDVVEVAHEEDNGGVFEEKEKKRLRSMTEKR